MSVKAKEKKHSNGKWIDYSYFKDVAKSQIKLTEQEEEALFKEYLELEREFRTTLLNSNPKVCESFLSFIQEVKDKNRSIAKLHSDFDSNREGHNRKIKDSLEKKLIEISTTKDVKVRTNLIYNMKLSKNTYELMYKQCDSIIPVKEKKKLEDIKEKIKEIETKLTCSVLMMGISIAQKYTSSMFNMDIKDGIQEATIAAFEAISLYDPSYRSKSGKRIKFSTYANIKAEKKIKEKIMETSRLVRLPKSRLEVLLMVLRACTNIENPSIDVITKRTNDILEKRKKRKLNPGEIISEERIVEALTLLNNNCIMLDSPIDEWSDTGDIKTFSDVIADTSPTAEENIIKKDSKKELTGLIRTYLDPLLSNIIIMRYIYDVPLSREEVSESLFNMKISKKKMNTETIRQKENFALKKLFNKDKGELKTILLETIAEKNRLEDR